ncbi:LytTR family transcriptional regulator DNA-binding domain-containing protein [Sebaldella sp. S0638]|uniref:LytTR family transcriptional regulator DNA-binding domain-containing protein n=1 Tax=Sebaldella sp. S0638 TaxID=2957809 RepID=UPI0020A166DC|nr:LytTR family transcriptional regulator DNA-binding domain-containing protein [Sebaldella sp. S0638]MCP1223010.1 LytTR family transcriptional regulator DNA-binding domain-containing protein [Sebaldella sp. S0638]
MIRIALEVEEALRTLLIEYFEYEFINTKNCNFQKIYSEHFDLAIIDSIHENLENRLWEYKSKEVKVILLATVFDIMLLRDLLHKKLIYDFLNKKDYMYIDEILENITGETERNSELCIEDSFVKTFVSINDIIYITYSRYTRKSCVRLYNGNEFFSKNNLVEIERILSQYPEFARVERSNIVNLSRIKQINYKKEVLVFDSEETLLLSKRTLKNVEDICINNKKTIKL